MIDTHCHLDFYPIPEKVAQTAETLNIFTIAVTNLPSHFDQSFAHVRQFTNVRLALGLHPLIPESHTDRERQLFLRLLDKTNYIGEVGLDFSRHGKSTTNEQIQSFRLVLDAIQHKNCFISVHSRGAEGTVLELFQNYNVSRATFHWYSGSLALLDQIIEEGHYISVNPAMIKSSKGVKIIERAGKDHILTETDGPYVSIGGRPAEPADVGLVVNFLSKLWQCPYAEAEIQIENTFREVSGRK